VFSEPRRIELDKLTFPETGLVRLNQILAPNGPIPVSKSSWWAGVKDGRFPKPQKLGPRTTVWRVEDIHSLIANGVSGDGAQA
jgi:prophage regulatory protein